jgi:ComF family protein
MQVGSLPSRWGKSAVARQLGHRTVLVALRDCVERWFFPSTCGGCGWPGAWWCSECQRSLVRVADCHPRCVRCDGLVPKPSAVCADCVDWPAALIAARALFLYRGPVRAALHRAKYRGERRRMEELASELGRASPEILAPWRSDLTCVVPIPLHPLRWRERGFNQSAILAKAVAGQLDIPLHDQLQRTRDTASQVGRTRSQRWANVAGAFVWSGSPLHGTVLLIDDTITTGATVAAGTTALVRAGASAVVVLAFARATEQF